MYSIRFTHWIFINQNGIFVQLKATCTRIATLICCVTGDSESGIVLGFERRNLISHGLKDILMYSAIHALQ